MRVKDALLVALHKVYRPLRKPLAVLAPCAWMFALSYLLHSIETRHWAHFPTFVIGMGVFIAHAE